MSDWIRVSEQSPKEEQNVLCYWPASTYAPESMESLQFFGADEYKGRDRWIDVFGNEADTPTHWMPRPDPPK